MDALLLLRHLDGVPAPVVPPFLSALAFSLAFAALQATTLTLLVGACFWIDLLPWLGVSRSFAVFRSTVSDTLACSVGGTASGVPGCTDTLPLYMAAVCIGSAVNLLGSVVLTWQSAVYAQIAACAGTALQSASFPPSRPPSAPGRCRSGLLSPRFSCLLRAS